MDSEKTFLLTIAYDGTHFVGWQIQPNGPSIQSLLQEKLSILLKEEVQVIGSGRTDSGVHALGQRAHFRTKKNISSAALIYPLNALLPHAIRVLEIKEVPNTFHARFSAKRKTYHYHLALGGVVLPFLYPFRSYVREKMDIELIKKGASYLVGTHNFISFANEASAGSAKKNPVRTLYRADVVEEEGGICFEFEGNGFLYKMVRNMVGQLIAIGKRKVPPETILDLFSEGSRVGCAAAAPPQGLFLVSVHYPEEILEGEIMMDTESFESLDLGVEEG